MVFDSVHRGWESGKTFGQRGLLEGGGINGETRDMVQMWMTDEISGDEVAEDMGGIRPCRLEGDLQRSERTGYDF